MNSHRISAHAVLAVALGLGGCVSIVSVKPADAKPNGIRYFLPETFIQVSAAKDGTVTLDKVYLADPKREYSIDATTYFGSHTLEVERDEKGLLKSVTFNSDSTGVAQQLISSAAAVRAAEIDAKSTKAKDEAALAKADADKAKAALEEADKARTIAKTALDVATRKLDLLQKVSNPSQDVLDLILTAQLAVVEAQAKKDAADAAYVALLGKTQSPSTKAANADDKGKESSWPQAMEPVLYRVIMGGETVQLKEAFKQSPRATWVAPKTEEAPELAVYPPHIVVRPADKNGALSKTVHLTLPAKAVAVTSFVRTSTGTALAKLPLLSLQLDQTSIDVEIPKELQAGDYEMDIGITAAKAESDAPPVTRTVRVRIEK